MDDKLCRIAVVGDSGVGKTSLITAAATETFPDSPMPVLPPARLPAETTPEGVPVLITDTSSRPEDKQAMEDAVREASVVVLCFAMDSPASLRRVASHWMPALRRLGVAAPVMLVGCKSDARPADASLHDAVLPLVRAHPAIETCMECSARKLQFVGEVFYYALKAVVHPMAPLYEPEAQALRPLARAALRRVFLLCDRDGDGVLSDAELNAFQVRCFNAPLQPEELAGVKAVVAERLPEGGLRGGGLALPGFLFLHALFIERGRLETTWAVLRRFGYANDLRLADAVLAPAAAALAARPADAVAELTPAGRDFFAAAFRRADADDDGVLSPREAEALFSTAPGDPWAEGGPHGARRELAALRVEASRRGHATLAGFLARWAATAALDPRRALEYALYLGYPMEAPLRELVAASRPRRAERRAAARQAAAGGGGGGGGGAGAERRRGTLQAAVVALGGAAADVAAAVLDGLVAPPGRGAPAAAAARPAVSAAAAVPVPPPPAAAAAGGAPPPAAPPADGGAVTLILHAYTEEQLAALLAAAAAARRERRPPPAELARLDAAVFAFDAAAPDARAAFAAAEAGMVALATAAGDELPCLFAAANAARMPTPVAEAAGAAAERLAVRPPAPAGPELYGAIVAAAFYPAEAGATPETPSLLAARRRRRLVRRAALYVGAGAAGAGAAYVAYRLFRRSEGKAQAQAQAAPPARR